MHNSVNLLNLHKGNIANAILKFAIISGLNSFSGIVELRQKYPLEIIIQFQTK